MNATKTIGKLACGVAALAAAGGLCVAARGQLIRIDDFNDEVADGWVQVDWIYNDPNIPITLDASSEVYRLGTAISVPSDEAELVISAWTESYDAASAALYSEGFLRAKIRALNDGTAVALALRATAPPCSGSTYVFFASPSGEIGILFVPNCDGVGDWIDDPGVENPVQAGFQPNGNWWWLEAGAIGNELSLRAWPDDG